LAKTVSAGSATVASTPKRSPKKITKIDFLSFISEPPTNFPMGRILIFKPSKNNAWPKTTLA